MTAPVSHPLVKSYLRDLEMLLHGIDSGERAEVLAGVHEHLDVSLRPGASDDDVRRTLAGLGSPQSVADEAYAGRPAFTPRRPAKELRWTGVLATGINTVCLLLLLVPVAFGAAHASELLFAFPLFALPWVGVSVLTALTGPWTSREKAMSMMLLPVTLVVLTTTFWVLLALVGPHIVNLLPALAILGAVTWVLVRLGRSALR